MTAQRAASEFGQIRRKYRWTPELRELLRNVYRARNKRQLTGNLDRLCRMTGWPRHALKYEAVRLGIETADHRRPWTSEEVAYLEERSGIISARKMASALGRSVESIQAKAAKLEFSVQVRDGYTVPDLQKAFGVCRARAESWVKRGLFGPLHIDECPRVADSGVARFLRRYPGEYELRRLDEDWFKGMLFGRTAGR